MAFLGDRLAYQLGREGVGAEAARPPRWHRPGRRPVHGGVGRAIEAARGGEAFAAAWTARTPAEPHRRRARRRTTCRPRRGRPGERRCDEAVEPRARGLRRRREAAATPRGPDAAARLAPVVDAFFTDVLVNAEDPARAAALTRWCARGPGVLGRVPISSRSPTEEDQVSSTEVWASSGSTTSPRDRATCATCWGARAPTSRR